MVVVTAGRLDPSMADRLQTVAERTAARHRWPAVDGVVLSVDMLAGGPSCARGHLRFRGRRVWSPADAPSPVGWHELAEHAVALGGPEISELSVWTDRRELEACTRSNLSTDWRRWCQRSSQAASLPGLLSFTAFGPVWGVLGVSRLAFTIATGQIVSKTDAGRHARASADPAWVPVIQDCLRLRAGGRGQLWPWRRRRDALDYVDAVIASHATDER